MMNRKSTKSMAFMMALAGMAGWSHGAIAQDGQDRGFYVRGGAGLNWSQDATNTGDGSSLDVESEYDNGFALQGALGMRLHSNVRGEIEVNYRDNDADELSVDNLGNFGAIGIDADGDVTSWGVMANGYYDFRDLGKSAGNSRFVPYLMGGIGWSEIEADISAGGTQVVDDDDSVFAYQIGAGVGYDVKEDVTLDLGYRYSATEDPEFTDSTGADFESEYDNHSLIASVRYRF